MLKETSKTLMINVEHDIAIGNDAITATVIHQVCLYNKKGGGIDADVDLIDITNVHFLGVKIDDGYKEFGEFKTKMKEMKIDVDKLIDEACAGIISTTEIQQLKIKYSSIFLK